jgi:hypothetical protein
VNGEPIKHRVARIVEPFDDFDKLVERVKSVKYSHVASISFSADRPAQSHLAARRDTLRHDAGVSAPARAMDEYATKLLHKWVREGRAEQESSD